MSSWAVRAVGTLAAFVALTAHAPYVGATPLDAIAYERFHVGAGAAWAPVHDLDWDRYTQYRSTSTGAAPLVGATIDAGYRFTRSFKLDASITVMHASGLGRDGAERSGTVFRLPVLATIVAPMSSRVQGEASAGMGIFHGVASQANRDHSDSTELTGVLVEVRAAICVHIVGELDAVLKFSAFFGLGVLGRDDGSAYGMPGSLGLRYRF